MEPGRLLVLAVGDSVTATYGRALVRAARCGSDVTLVM